MVNFSIVALYAYKMIRRLLNVFTVLILAGTAAGTYEALTGSYVLNDLYKALGVGLCLLALVATFNYIFFNKISVFHKKGE